MRTFFAGARARCPKPKHGYPLELKTLGQHVLKRRLDLGLTRQAAARRLGVNDRTVENWERGKTQVPARAFPSLIAFLGYNPLPGSLTPGGMVQRERLTAGWSRKRLAQLAGVDEATVARLERDVRGLARRPREAVIRILDLSQPEHKRQRR